MAVDSHHAPENNCFNFFTGGPFRDVGTDDKTNQ